MTAPGPDRQSSETPSESSTPTRHRSFPTRRGWLLGIGGVATGALAGCLGGRTPESAREPVEPASDASCGICKMKPAKYPDWNAQVVLEDGARVHFCSPGCVAAFYADPGRFVEDQTRERIAAAWVTDYTSKEWTDAMTASFVLETNAKRIDAPMMKNPVPFAETADASAYVDQYDDLGSDDVVGIEAFDVALARTYRPNAFP